MKSQAIYKSEDPDEIGTCCTHARQAHNSYGCANCADEQPKKGRQGIWEGVTDPSRYGGSAGHSFEGQRGVSGNATTGGPGWKAPNVSKFSAPHSYNAQRHAIILDLHDKFHGTGQCSQKHKHTPDCFVEKSKKSQRIFKARTPDVYTLQSRKTGRRLTHFPGVNESSRIFSSGGGGGRTMKEYGNYSNASVGRMLRTRDRSKGLRGKIRGLFGAPKLIER